MKSPLVIFRSALTIPGFACCLRAKCRVINPFYINLKGKGARSLVSSVMWPGISAIISISATPGLAPKTRICSRDLPNRIIVSWCMPESEWRPFGLFSYRTLSSSILANLKKLIITSSHFSSMMLSHSLRPAVWQQSNSWKQQKEESKRLINSNIRWDNKCPSCSTRLL